MYFTFQYIQKYLKTVFGDPRNKIKEPLMKYLEGKCSIHADF